MEQLGNWLPWIAGMGVVGGVIGYAVGLPAFLLAIAKILDMISPLVKAIFEAIVAALRWSWETVFWPGLKDIFDSWATIATVLVISWVLWTVMDQRIDLLTDDLGACQTENVKLKKKFNAPTRSNDWLWPLW